MRLISLDVLRGCAVFGMILVNSAAAMKWGAEAAVHPILLHVPWSGLTLADLVFPAFLMMVGVAIPFSLRSPQGIGEQGRPILWRTVRLVLLGFLLSNLYWFQDFSSGEWRLFGVLQRIGLVYGLCALLFLLASPRARLVMIVAILTLYWPLVLLPAGDGLATDIGVRGHNFAAYLDRLMLGPHLYVQGREGYDPEGILGTLPALAHGLIGVAIGELLMRKKEGLARPLALAGAAMLALGYAWSFAFPIVKDIWSSSFVLVTCGITTLALAGLHHWLGGPGEQGLAARLVSRAALPFGTNAIAAYALHMVTAGMVTWQLLLVPFFAARPFIGEEAASLLPVALYLAFIWAAMAYLRRRGWVVKI